MQLGQVSRKCEERSLLRLLCASSIEAGAGGGAAAAGWQQLASAHKKELQSLARRLTVPLVLVPAQ